MKLSIIAEAKPTSFDNLSKAKARVQRTPIHKLLGFKKPLDKLAEGSFATIYEHPDDNNILIKVTTHDEDVRNVVRAQRLMSNNVVKLHKWDDGKLAKELPTLKAWALLVEKISGEPIDYSTGHFYKLCYNGNFEFAKDWLMAGGSPEQLNILKLYNLDDDSELYKLAELFGTLHELSKYGIDLSDFDQNVIDNGSRYVIIDLGF